MGRDIHCIWGVFVVHYLCDMSKSHSPESRTVPTRFEAAVFGVKSRMLQLQRALMDRDARRLPTISLSVGGDVIAESRTKLWTETEPEERYLVAGKIQNLRIAVRRLNGLTVPANEVFSFWKQVGRATRRRGYVEGRELREGCIIPNLGGGLCQLSNALYDAALKAEFEIVERHAHTQAVAGSLAEIGRDATVFWNYVDLRFRSPADFRIEALLRADELLVRFYGEKASTRKLHPISRRMLHSDQPQACVSCGMNDCHRAVESGKHADFGRTAFLVDDVWPEFDRYLQQTRADGDVLFLPIDGGRFRKSNYAWTTSVFDETRSSPFVTAIRSYRSRRLAEQGAARQLNLLQTYEKLAASYAERLGHDCLHLVVQQNLLPYLWRTGHLGGRTFDVLMTAFPIDELQRRLDAAHVLHPESTTLGDFRADPRLAELEADALANARRLITPHTAIAAHFGERAELIEWMLPAVKPFERPRNSKPRIVFASSTVGRKGCYELREALSGIDCVIVLTGPLIEGKDFWSGFETMSGISDPLVDADVVVLPAFIEHKPRRLLRAAALGIPVIASTACGVGNVAGVREVADGSVEGLRTASNKLLLNPRLSTPIALGRPETVETQNIASVKQP